MFAKIKHLAIVSQNYAMEAKFFQALFGMKVAESQRPEQRAMVVSDGYVGMNINGRAPGRQAGFDHFGFEVEDVEVVFARLREKYPTIEVMKRPGNRPFAGLSLHDPAGTCSIFLSEVWRTEKMFMRRVAPLMRSAISNTLPSVQWTLRPWPVFTGRCFNSWKWKNPRMIPTLTSRMGG